MRIIGGKYQRYQIHPPAGFKARPTTDIAKEALFNILENHFDFQQIEALDLFSGSGSISYELASRGIKVVWAIENDIKNFTFIKETCKKLNFNNLIPVKTDVFRFLIKNKQQFDLIFADPPFNHPGIINLPNLIFNGGWLKTNGIFIIEHDKKNNFINHEHFLEERKYGHVHFSFMK